MFASLLVGLLLAAPQDKPEGKELKVFASSRWFTAGAKEPQQLVIRSAEELSKSRGHPTGKAAEDLAKAFKVEAIDWKKQMVVVVSVGRMDTTGYSVEFTDLKVKDGVLTVRWRLNKKVGGEAITYTAQAALVERFEGKVVFDPPAPKGEKKGDR
jgi:hypothetical protein